MSPKHEHDRDAEIFVEEADSTPFGDMTRNDAKLWLFRLKKKLSERYETQIESHSDTDYVVSLTAEDDAEATKAEFVVDRRGGEVEVNAHVISDGEATVHEVWKE